MLSSTPAAKMASGSWKRCLDAAVYIVVVAAAALTTAVAFFAISSAYQLNKTQDDAGRPTNSSSSSCPAILSDQLTHALRSSGYNLVADILQKSPQCLLPPSEGTLFAIPDIALHQILLPSPAKRDLLRYHISPQRFVFEDLLQLPPHSCLPTLLGRKNLGITKTDPEERTVEINRIPISDPDISAHGPYTVHGILAPFYSPGPEDGRFFAEGALIPESSCGASSGIVAEEAEDVKRQEAVEWPHILHLLSRNGFLPFAIGLQSVLEGIVREHGDLSSVTVFAPRECDLSCFPLPPKLLEQRIMLHILPGRVSYADLALLPDKALLPTLLPGQHLQITVADGFAHIHNINGVEVVAPDIVATEIGKHGVITEFTDPDHSIRRSATYLPEAAAHEGWTKTETIDSLMRKAGYNSVITEQLRKRIRLTRYQSTLYTMHYSDYATHVRRTRGAVPAIAGVKPNF